LTHPPEIDVAVGMEVYASMSEPCEARLRLSDSDFIVTEVLRAEVLQERREGYLPVYRVEKRSIDTMHMAREVSRELRSRVSYCGLKDKRATAIQYLTPTSSRSATPALIEGRGYRAELIGYSRRPLGRGSIAGNSFRITMRGCCSRMGECLGEVSALAAQRRLPNFYGHQRFGGRGASTHLVGRAIVRRDFEGAVKTIVSEPRATDDELTSRARELAARGEYGRAAALLPASQDTERLVLQRLAKRGDDYVGALRAVPIQLRRMFTTAYQSYIFNRTLSACMRTGLDISNVHEGDNWGEVDEFMSVVKVHGVRERATEGAVPLIQMAGYAYRNYGSRFDACLEAVLREECVSPADFYVEEMQELSVEGGFRRPFMSVSGMRYSGDGDTWTVSFNLARGEYATSLLREVVKPRDPASCGFL
jgi:tRNA pseudouridine13 synthase